MAPSQFVAACIDCVGAGGDASAVSVLVKAALLSQRDDPAWREVGEIMYRSNDLLIVNLTLPADAATPPHTHGTWAVVGISVGCEIDRFFLRERGTERPLTLVEEVTVLPGCAIALTADTIHSIRNPLSSEGRGIHVYGGDIFSVSRRMWNPFTGQEHAYEGSIFEGWCQQLTHAATTADEASDREFRRRR